MNFIQKIKNKNLVHTGTEKQSEIVYTNTPVGMVYLSGPEVFQNICIDVNMAFGLFAVITGRTFLANRSSEVYFSAAARRGESSTALEAKENSSVRRAAAGQRVSCLLLKEISESGL